MNLLLTYYGDDFTGSTDVMEALVLGGVPAVLFLNVPDEAFIREHFPDVRAIGVAGVSRSMSPDQMEAELPPVFRALQQLGAPLFHYKICSTFDSSPTVGNIGTAAEIGWRVFQPQAIPMMVGAPPLKRYVAFGNLFATVGENTYRLDRHPTMSKHPITPMDESDLRLHLGKQTGRKIGLIDTLQLAQSDDALAQHYQTLVDDGCEVILFDTLDQTHVQKIGRLVWAQRGERPIFSVSSSGLEYALTAHWQQTGFIEAPPPLPSVGAVEQLLIISGSAAPGTAGQIQWAMANDFEAVRLDGVKLVDPALADAERERVIEQALASLGQGRNLLLYSALGPDDPAIAATNGRLDALGLGSRTVGQRLGTQQGLILRELLERTGLKRACVTGGDTCGHAAHQLGIYALEILMPVAPGAPLCRARSHNPRFDGLQISLKAGQVGKPDYFGSILRGA
ncbi:MAG: four-carbon acid sugar kinase family protein [Chloroflexi bacterium]|nr:four-carbon acid sugar kinase family protein [Chloroflexota bacterium]